MIAGLTLVGACRCSRANLVRAVRERDPRILVAQPTEAEDTSVTESDAGDPVSPDPVAISTAPPTIGGCALFPPDNPWNTEVSSLPVDPRSDAIIANIQSHGDTFLHADFGSNPEYGIPYSAVPATQPGVPIRYNEYGDESDPGPFPIPLDAPVERGRDHHVLVVQSGTCRLFELYHARRDGAGWIAGSGATWNLASNRTRRQTWTSCDQAGLPILPGLVRYEEVANRAILHALRVTFEHTREAWIDPATHPGGDSDPDAPPMGMRLRLRRDYDISRVRGAARVVLVAMRRYGMFVADTGGNWFVSGGTDRRWNDDDLDQLKRIPGTAFEVLRMGPLHTRP